MPKPTLFIASSVEGLSVAEVVNANLDQTCECTLWPHGTFKLGSFAIKDLITKSSLVDFAVFVFTPDDLTTIRDHQVATARDNVVFELGLFVGSIGLERCYAVKPRGVDMHLPTDLLSINTADYVPDRSDNDTASALNAACTKIKERVAELGSLRRAPYVAPGAADKRVSNPRDYKLQEVDLSFLAQCVQSHVSSPEGQGHNYLESKIQGVPEYRVAISAIKLVRLGYVVLAPAPSMKAKSAFEDMDGDGKFSLGSCGPQHDCYPCNSTCVNLEPLTALTQSDFP